MVFSSISFIYYFLPIVIIVYYIFNFNYRIKNGILLIFSLFFYYYGEKNLVLLLIFSIFFNYFYAKIIQKYRFLWVLWIGIVVNLLLLFYFKYTNFLIENLNQYFYLNIKWIYISLPIGISFFTFQGLSYLVDVYRNDVEASTSLITFGTYLSMFPQLVAGPIVRYQTVARELENRCENFEQFSLGIKRFSLGLFKKVVIANTLGKFVYILVNLSNKTILSYWLEVIASTLQLYYDFSAYSDMAIGMGLFFGFHFLENFNYPLFSKSITYFWNNWHISLSRWLRDYIYIPLGGNKFLVRNVLIVWFCSGFWHGSNWNFILWGLSLGLVLLFEKRFLLKYLVKLRFLSRLWTFLIIVLLFVMFNHESFIDIMVYYKSLFGLNDIQLLDSFSIYYLSSYIWFLSLTLLGTTPFFKIVYLKFKYKLPEVVDILGMLFSLVLLVICSGYLLYAGFNPFLYFRF